MEVTYNVYQYDDGGIIVSCDTLPGSFIKLKKKFIGKRAKIEAISRLSQINLPQDLATKEINEFINKNYFGKPIWHTYHTIFQEVANELKTVTINCNFQYHIYVSFEDGVIHNPQDDTIIQLITDYLLNPEIPIKSPISKIKKL